MDHIVEYPKKLYHQDGRVARVLSIDEHALYAREGWAESPAGPFETTVPEPEPAPEPEVPEDEEQKPPRGRRRS